MSAYLAVINTGSPSYSLMHDASKPYAVVEVSVGHGTVRHVLSRHESYKGACISCGRKIAKRKKNDCKP